MAAKLNWHRYGTKSRHRHPMYTVDRVKHTKTKSGSFFLEHGAYAVHLPFISQKPQSIACAQLEIPAMLDTKRCRKNSQPRARPILTQCWSLSSCVCRQIGSTDNINYVQVLAPSVTARDKKTSYGRVAGVQNYVWHGAPQQ